MTTRNVTTALLVFGVLLMLYTAWPVYCSGTTRARMMKSVAHHEQVVKACKIYAIDHAGRFPAMRTDLEVPVPFSNSTEAFNELIRETKLGTEASFYVKGNPDKNRVPNQDGLLTVDENCLVYVTGQDEKRSATSPLVAEEMESLGVYGANHPWLNDGKAVVGYCGGQVEIERLRKTNHGAFVRKDGISDIFQEVSAGGLLAVPRRNILLP